MYYWKNRTILIFEDDEANLLLLTSSLERTMVSILHAKNGLDGITEFVKAKKIDLILMDINMPYLDGFYAAKRIRETSAIIPVIAQTVRVIDSDTNQFIRAGFNEVIYKPINIAKMLKTIDKYFKADSVYQLKLDLKTEISYQASDTCSVGVES